MIYFCCQIHNYILSDILVSSFAECFYVLCHILTTHRALQKANSDTTYQNKLFITQYKLFITQNKLFITQLIMWEK